MCVSLRFRADRVPPVIPVICLWVLGLPAAPTAKAQPAPPTPPPLEFPAPALEADAATGTNAAQLGIPLCETTGFEANEPTCNWEAGYGICGSTFFCRDTAVDGPYPTTCEPPLTQPDNCCVNAPNPDTGWYMSITSQHCQEPHISTENPKTGLQHLRFQRSTQGGNPAGCVAPNLGDTTTAANLNCRLSAFTANANPNSPAIPLNPGLTITSFDVSRSADAGVPGMRLEWSNQSNSENQIAQKIMFHYIGYVFAADYDLGQYIFMGYTYGGVWHHVRMEHDICRDEIRYYWDSLGGNGPQLIHTGCWSCGASQNVQSIEQSVWISDNTAGAFFDIDNFSVTRHLVEACACGDGFLAPDEECEVGADCCPGRCIPPGEPGECSCRRENTLESCAPRELFEGLNGPFRSDGGLYSYTADSPFTAIDACNSARLFAIFWDLSPDCSEHQFLSVSCSGDGDYLGTCDLSGGPCHGDYDCAIGEVCAGSQQDTPDPTASCYSAHQPRRAGCLCVPTVPGRTYTFLVGTLADLQPSPCSNTTVRITGRDSCAAGPTVGGACCDTISGACADNVEAEVCTGPYEVYIDNRPCSMVSCEPVLGSCCHSLTGFCEPSIIQADCNCGHDCIWTTEVDCGGACVAATGACCVMPQATGTPARCTDGLKLGECDEAGGEWTRDASCDEVECFVAIPAVSEWGLVVLALVLLVGGKVYWGSVGRIPRQGKP